jgi:hypothetical protein
MIGKNIRFSVSKFHIVEQLRYSMGSGFLLISAGTGALMSERNSRKSVATAARPTSRRFWFVGLFIVAICTGLAVWQLWHTLFAPRADSTATDSGQSGLAAHREGVEPVAQPSNMGGSANSTPSSTQVPDQLRQSNQRIDGSAGRLELDPPSAIAVDPDCLKSETQQSGSGSPTTGGITPQEMVSQATAKLQANQEFPINVHVVRWEMAFGLPGPGVLFWAEWSGENPARYSIYVQDARTPQSEWDAAGKAPIQQREKGLAWEDALKILKEIKYPLVQSFGPASYRRFIVTDAIPIDPAEAQVSNSDTATQLSVEVLGPRILYFSRPGLSCSRAEGSAMKCSCAAPHAHKE